MYVVGGGGGGEGGGGEGLFDGFYFCWSEKAAGGSKCMNRVVDSTHLPPPCVFF